MFSTPTVNPFSRAVRHIQCPSSQSSITLRDWVHYSAQRGFRPEKPCQMESIFILNANTTDTHTARALLLGTTTQTSWWVENFRERSLNKQCLPVRMCQTHSQVQGLPFDLFTGNLFLHDWLCWVCRLQHAWGAKLNITKTPTFIISFFILGTDFIPSFMFSHFGFWLVVFFSFLLSSWAISLILPSPPK